MNLLRTLWNWLASSFAEAPSPAIEEQECCEEECEPEEECCDHEDCEPPSEPVVEIHVKEEPTPVIVEEVQAPEPVQIIKKPATDPDPVGKLLREILLSEGISENVISKHQIIETFEGWYTGPTSAESVRDSIQDFKLSHGGAIKAKLSRIK